jgi:hypothetical protein
MLPVVLLEYDSSLVLLPQVNVPDTVRVAQVVPTPVFLKYPRPSQGG